MGDPKFTPEPWKLYSESHGVHVEPNVAWIGYGSAHTEAEHKANAAIVAAACAAIAARSTAYNAERAAQMEYLRTLPNPFGDVGDGSDGADGSDGSDGSEKEKSKCERIRIFLKHWTSWKWTADSRCRWIADASGKGSKNESIAR